jgi:hypothetical protein
VHPLVLKQPISQLLTLLTSRSAIICGLLAVGLLVDQTVPTWGQILTNVAVWGVLGCFVLRSPQAEQSMLIACVVYATLGEIFCSLIWGIYDYRLGNVPLFVPPGHALLLMLGFALSRHLSDAMAWSVPLLAAPFVLLQFVTGIDTFGLVLFGFFLACMIWGPAKKLYATMFVLSLVLEIYGTWLGNWTWKVEVPGLPLTTINPPLAAGAFYCMLDLLVTATAPRLLRKTLHYFAAARHNLA